MTEPETIELIELDHSIQNGSMVIGEETYQIKNGKVSVKPEHLQEARLHIKMVV
jgi:predicted membrane protein